MSIRFPYRFKPSPFGRLCDPLIKIPVSTINGWREYDFVIDTGSDVSMVPRFMAEQVGTKLNLLPQSRSYGIDGKGLSVYRGKLDIQIGKYKFDLPCLFSSVEETPFLLGRTGLFDLFSIQFDNEEKEIVFHPLLLMERRARH